jgi:hypothetical protein
MSFLTACGEIQNQWLSRLKQMLFRHGPSGGKVAEKYYRHLVSGGKVAENKL